MLEGLEAVEIKLIELYNENWTFRFDSEYLKKQYLKNIQQIKKSKQGFLKLKDAIYHLSGGATPLGAEYQTEGIPFLRVQNIMQNYFNLNDVVYLTKTQDEEIKRSRLKEKDVLLTITGVSYGKSATITKELENANINQHSVKISLNSKLNPYFLSTFFNSKHGKLQSDKNIVGVTRPALDYQVIKNFNIPKISINFQDKIEKLIKLSEKATTQSQQTYTQAENLLLETLGLKDFKPSKEKVNIKSFKDSFLSTGRLDAEYYQPKYEEIEGKLRSFYNWDILGKQIEKIDTGEYSPEYLVKGEKEDLTFYIRSTNIKGGQIDIDNNYYVPKREFVRVAKKGNIVTARVGSVGVFGEVREELDGAIYSDNVLCFQLPENFISSVYTLIFNSEYYFELIDRLARGSVQQRLNQETLKDLIIPIIDIKIQHQISDKIEESFRLKKQSEQLLELAKTAVEKAIEEDEDVAMAYIKNGLIGIGEVL